MIYTALPAKSYQALWVIFSVSQLILTTCVGTIYCVNQLNPSMSAKNSSIIGRDYNLNPFAIYDAITICREEATLKLGSELLESVVDDLSTRFESRRKIYLVVLKGRIGSKSQFYHNQIICHVDPKQYVVNYFKSSRNSYREFSMDFFR